MAAQAQVRRRTSKLKAVFLGADGGDQPPLSKTPRSTSGRCLPNEKENTLVVSIQISRFLKGGYVAQPASLSWGGIGEHPFFLFPSFWRLVEAYISDYRVPNVGGAVYPSNYFLLSEFRIGIGISLHGGHKAAFSTAGRPFTRK